MAQVVRHHDIVVIGASAGGVRALQKIVAELPPQFPAAVAIVLHTGAHRSQLPRLLSAAGPNPCVHATEGTIVRHGCLLIAPPDHHLLFRGESVHLTRGPKEHYSRPAIDPLFRSAAIEYGSRVIGVILTGRLDDGTAGLQAIHQNGGLTVVQDPRSAQAPSMPRSALDNVVVDVCVPLERIASTLTSLVQQIAPPLRACPTELLKEHAVATGEVNALHQLQQIGTLVPMVCPECGGPLWEISNCRPPRFRCHTGHAYSLRTLKRALDDTTENTLWAAMRALQERALLNRRLATHRRGPDPVAAAAADSQAIADDARAAQLRQLIDRSR